ncbi:MAG: hypothetical protein ABJC19_01620 [Gemmatimonadota bacterium]
MLWTLAIRHLLVRPGRAAVLLLGFAIGVAVMIVLLSVGDAMLEQSRDIALVGGGELTVLPEGVDVEALRTGGMTGLFFGIDRARFVTRQLLGGPRQAGVVRAVSPVLEQKLLVIRTRDRLWTVRAGGELPSATARLGSAVPVLAGEWRDSPLDAQWLAPASQALYDELDRFHVPTVRDSTWAEWHYFNVVVGPSEWWYITYLIGGDLPGGRWGGRVLATHRRPDGSHHRFETTMPASAVQFDTTAADVTLGANTVRQVDGVYRIEGRSEGATFGFTLTPAPRRYFPPVELRDDRLSSGYVVPALVAVVSGRFCDGSSCQDVVNAAAYHDHNWGVWRDVTWAWGSGQGASHALLYGGVVRAGEQATAAPFFFALVDSLGVQQVYRFEGVERIGSRPVPGRPGVSAPDSLRILAVRRADTLRVTVAIEAADATPSGGPGIPQWFLQMRGHWTLRGRAAGVPVADSGRGFFEVWQPR